LKTLKPSSTRKVGSISKVVPSSLIMFIGDILSNSSACASTNENAIRLEMEKKVSRNRE
jgi:hypothetical protein